MIRVVNKHNHKPTELDVYVGRGSVLGNPYSSIQSVETKAEFICESREEAIRQFSFYLKQKIDNKDKSVCDELNKIWLMAHKGDVNLVCYCAPKSCHANTIKNIIESKLKIHKTYEGEIKELTPNQIFVFGSNTQGRHGKGAALSAKEKFGAINGQSRGRQGNSYAIITKDLTVMEHPSRTPEQIIDEIRGLYEYATQNPGLEFLIPYKAGHSNLNAYSSQDMAFFFNSMDIPKNIVFDKEFYSLIHITFK